MRRPPAGLTDAAKSWWKRIVAEFAVDDEAGLLLLEQALRAFDRMNEAAQLIATHGVATPDRWGQLRVTPACAVERDSRAAMLAALRELNLSVEPCGRSPAGLRGADDADETQAHRTLAPADRGPPGSVGAAER